jgi:hypothetical protein
MKSISLILFFFILSISFLKAQNPEPVKTFKYIFKANINYSQRHGNFQIGNVAPDWIIKNKKGNLHEFELTEISVNRKEFSNYGLTKSSSFRLRYQYDILLIKKDKKIIPFIGFSALASTSKNNYQSSDTYNFSFRTFNSGLVFAVVPGVFFFPCKNLSIDFSMPLDLAGMRYHQQYVANPNIPSNQQSNSNLDFNSYFLRTLRFRVGIGLRI